MRYNYADLEIENKINKYLHTYTVHTFANMRNNTDFIFNSFFFPI